MFLLLCTLLFAAPKGPSWGPTAEQIDLYNTAVGHYNAGDLAEARSAIEQLLKAQPDCGAARTIRANILLLTGNPAESLAELQQLSQSFPKEDLVWLTLSQAAFALQDFTLALDASKEAVRLEPSSFEAQRALNLALVRLGRYDEALAALKTARNRGSPPAALDCLEVGVLVDQKQADPARAKMASCEQSTDLNLVRFTRSNLALLTGDYQAAAESADAAGAEHMGRQGRAVLLAESGDYAGCIQILDQVVTQEPENVGARLQRANCLHNAARDAEARADLERAFGAGTWVTIQENGSLTGILTYGSEQEFKESTSKAALLLVELQLEAGDRAAAEGTWTALSQSFPGTDATLAATALVEAGSNRDPWPGLWAAVEQRPGSELLLETASSLLLQRPAGVPAGLPARIVAQGSWADLYNLSAFYYNSQKFSECVRVVEPALERVEEGHRAALRDVLYSCAAGADDLTRLDQVLALRGSPQGLPAPDLLQHAWLRVKAGRASEARTIWEAACTSPPKEIQEGCRQVETRLR
jgi:tetratricopeptide (TPR) repeat protein